MSSSRLRSAGSTIPATCGTRFTETRHAFIRDWNLGSDAVIVFFIMSGLVIAFAAERDGTCGRFAVEPAPRLLCVLAPVLVVTLVLDMIGLSIDPGSYPPGFYQHHPVPEILRRGLSFPNEWGVAAPVRLGTNGPLWSLSYEAGYDILFGVAMVLRGATRAVLRLAICLVLGVNVLLRAPAWLMGVLVWRWIAGGGAARLARVRGRALALADPAA